jgi:putative ABC transport system substrate-binding protein
MMRRRVLLGWLGGVALASSWRASAQSRGRVYRIGFLASVNPASTPRVRDAFLDAMRERGYVEGQNLTLEYRWSEDAGARLDELALELVRAKVDLIFAWATPAALAAMRATSTTPIVFVGAGDPVGSGLVASLASPGKNVTGFSNVARDLSAKLVELLVQVVPGMTRLAVMRNASNPSTALQLKESEAAARKLGLQVLRVDVATPGDIETAFANMSREHAAGVVVMPDPMLLSHRQRVAELALQYRLPTIFARRESAEAGGLMAYGASLADQVRDATLYIDKILKGAKPADLPVQEPTKLELVINLKTAKALGLTIPQSLLLRADEVLQ